MDTKPVLTYCMNDPAFLKSKIVPELD